mmetsp:Transcript_30466/g.101275  ORF Transcript_30466/g.101275 Transcript_30466/m.101275 type:complete len:217 (+) Transcript_30466:1252-1902(+)
MRPTRSRGASGRISPRGSTSTSSGTSSGRLRTSSSSVSSTLCRAPRTLPMPRSRPKLRPSGRTRSSVSGSWRCAVASGCSSRRASGARRAAHWRTHGSSIPSPRRGAASGGRSSRSPRPSQAHSPRRAPPLRASLESSTRSTRPSGPLPPPLPQVPPVQARHVAAAGPRAPSAERLDSETHHRVFAPERREGDATAAPPAWAGAQTAEVAPLRGLH